MHWSEEKDIILAREIAASDTRQMHEDNVRANNEMLAKYFPTEVEVFSINDEIHGKKITSHFVMSYLQITSLFLNLSYIHNVQILFMFES